MSTCQGLPRVYINMEHGWLVSGAQLIDPTLVLSLTFDNVCVSHLLSSGFNPVPEVKDEATRQVRSTS